MLEDLRNYTADGATLNEIARRIDDLRDQLEREPYVFDRRFLFRILSMGHSQLAPVSYTHLTLPTNREV